MAALSDWNDSVSQNELRTSQFFSGSGISRFDSTAIKNVSASKRAREARFQNQIETAEQELDLFKHGGELGNKNDSEEQVQASSDMTLGYALDIAQERECVEEAQASLWATWVSKACSQATIYINDNHLIDKKYLELAKSKLRFSEIVKQARFSFEEEACSHKHGCIPSWIVHEPIWHSGRLVKEWRPSKGAVDATASQTALILFAEYAISLAEELVPENESRISKSDLSGNKNQMLSKQVIQEKESLAGQSAVADSIDVHRGTAKVLLDLDAAEKAVETFAKKHFGAQR